MKEAPRVSGVIPSWTEALQLMEEGAKWHPFIPSSLAYGEKGAGPQIGAHATLIFEVELASIQKKKHNVTRGNPDKRGTLPFGKRSGEIL